MTYYPGDDGLFDVLSVVYPFAQEGSFVIVNGNKQCELEGYFLSPDGVYEATNIEVSAERGPKL